MCREREREKERERENASARVREKVNRSVQRRGMRVYRSILELGIGSMHRLYIYKYYTY